MEDTKRCPFCGEVINKAAKKCRHCGEWLTEKPLSQNCQTLSDVANSTEKEKGPSMTQSILVGCLFLLFFYGGIAGVILAIAHFTIPSDSRMERAIMNDVQSCVEDKAVSFSGFFGEEASALASLFLSTEASAQSISEQYRKNNRTVIERSWFWSVGKIYNRNTPDGTNVCFGIFGIVIPYVAWEDFILMNEE